MFFFSDLKLYSIGILTIFNKKRNFHVSNFSWPLVWKMTGATFLADRFRGCAILALESVHTNLIFCIKIRPRNLFYKILCLPFQQGKLVRTTSLIFHEWFLGHFFKVSARKGKNSQIFSMSAITPYINYMQYEGGCAAQIRHIFSTSDDGSKNQAHHQYKWGCVEQASKLSSFGPGGEDTTQEYLPVNF